MATSRDWLAEFQQAAATAPWHVKSVKTVKSPTGPVKADGFETFGSFDAFGSPIEDAVGLAAVARLPVRENLGPAVLASTPAPMPIPAEWSNGVWTLMGMTTPANINPAYWGQVVADASSFLTTWGAVARAMGWTTLQLFGVDARKPDARTDTMGLCWLLQGRTVVAVTADKIAVRNRQGVVKNFYRQPEAPGAVPLWDLV